MESFTSCTSYDCKKRTISKNSYELHQYMPCCILVLLVQFTLLLLHVRLSKAFARFSIPCHRQYYFRSTTFIHKNQRQRSHFAVRSAKLRACYLHSQLGFGRVLGELVNCSSPLHSTCVLHQFIQFLMNYPITCLIVSSFY